jgi:hypothetical protein
MTPLDKTARIIRSIRLMREGVFCSNAARCDATFDLAMVPQPRQLGGFMFRKSHAFVSHKVIVATLFASILSTSALAYQSPSTGLGQAWPNAADVSVSPHYHVYVFVRDGIRYIQVNDLNGTIHGAVAVADDEVLVLPIGADAQYVTTAQASTQVARVSSNTETVYNDGSAQLTAEPASNGVVKIGVITAEMTCQHTNPTDCSGNVISRIGN